jgi:hypothetical protein
MKSKRYIRISGNEKRKQKGERAVFRRFARSGGTVPSILMASIASRRPPQPDIYCLSTSHIAYRFELCELADQGMKDARGNHQLSLDKYINPGHLGAFNAKYDTCDVYVSRPSQNIAPALRAVAGYLLSDATVPHAPSSGSDSVVIRLRDILGDPNDRGLVQIRTLGPSFSGTGARWHVESGGSFGDGIERALQRKTSRTYSLRGEPCMSQLLLYFDNDPHHMVSFACQEEIDRLRTVWAPRFTNVWVFDLKTSTVVVHEEA